jgi:ABC-type nitrate/sulfonate/bicarbonate transport system substrate-binding protein
MSPRMPISLLALILVAILVFSGCQTGVERGAQDPPLKLSIAVRPAPDSGLIAIADEKGYFNEAGMEVSTRLYPSGLLALEAVVRGEAQMATVADVAFVPKMLESQPVRVVASIGFSTGSQIVARKDRSIQEPSDLKGKRIGFSPDTTSDYFLYTFLLTENISPTGITAVPIPPGMQTEALVKGDVDAVSAFDVYAFEAKKRLGENAVSWDCQNNLGYQWLLAAGESLTHSPEPIKRFLRALMKAESFLLANEAEAKSIIVRKWSLDPEFVRLWWSEIRLNVSFNQSIITSLSNYGRWKMNKEGKSETPPDVLDFIYTGALDEVAPRVVTIFR